MMYAASILYNAKTKVYFGQPFTVKIKYFIARKYNRRAYLQQAGIANCLYYQLKANAI